MKPFIAALLLIPLLSSCSMFPNGFSDSQITVAVQVATGAVLSHITPSDRQHAIANYADVVASALRTVTGSPTPDQLSALLASAIPSSVRSQYPELQQYIIPLVVAEYQALYAKYQGDVAKIYRIANDIAVGVENGASSYIR